VAAMARKLRIQYPWAIYHVMNPDFAASRSRESARSIADIAPFFAAQGLN
jgi:hypothetical protein